MTIIQQYVHATMLAVVCGIAGLWSAPDERRPKGGNGCNGHYCKRCTTWWRHVDEAWPCRIAAKDYDCQACWTALHARPKGVVAPFEGRAQRRKALDAPTPKAPEAPAAPVRSTERFD